MSSGVRQIHTIHITGHKDVRQDQIEAALEALNDIQKPLMRSLLQRSENRVV
jgi:hypothetical protein